MNTAIRTARKYFTGSNIQSADFFRSVLMKKYKIAVFVPLKNADEIAFQMASFGAGIIGNYTVCSFRTKGIGTFLGGKVSNPAKGRKGKFEMVEELRVEMICDKKYLEQVLDVVYKTHPYEEPACDVYEVLVRDLRVSSKIIDVRLKKSVPAADVLKKINSRISEDNLPDSVKKAKIKHVVLDDSGCESLFYPATSGKTMYIKKMNKEIKIEIV